MAVVALKDALGILGDVWTQKKGKLLDILSGRRAHGSGCSGKHSIRFGKTVSDSTVFRSANESASRSLWCGLKQRASRIGHGCLESAERSARMPFRAPGASSSRFTELVQRSSARASARARAPYSRARLLLSMSPLVPVFGSLLAPDDVDALEAAALSSLELERPRLEDSSCPRLEDSEFSSCSSKAAALCFDDLSLLRAEFGLCDVRLHPANRVRFVRAAITRPLREWTFAPNAPLGCAANRSTLIDALHEVCSLHFAPSVPLCLLHLPSQPFCVRSTCHIRLQ